MGFWDFIPAVKNMEKAEKLNMQANKTVQGAKQRIKHKKKKLEHSLELYGELKLNILSTSIYDFVSEFEKINNVNLNESNIHNELKKLKFGKLELKQLKDASVTMKELTTGGVTAISSGALAGAAAYGSVSLLATASTGTAIGTLSGATATNATLAWLGGGSLAAGGGGMAVGAVVLGGIVAAPILAIGYTVFHSKSKENLAVAKINNKKAQKFNAEINLAISKMNAIIERLQQMSDVLSKLNYRLIKSIGLMQDIIKKNGTDFSKYTENQKEIIYTAVMFAQATKSLLDVNLLTDNGDLDKENETILLESNKLLSQ
jgi:hypothetical protein